MPRLVAWLVYTAPASPGAWPTYEACFVSEDTPARVPACRRFATEGEARAWICAQADAFGAIVVWRVPSIVQAA